MDQPFESFQVLSTGRHHHTYRDLVGNDERDMKKWKKEMEKVDIARYLIASG